MTELRTTLENSTEEESTGYPKGIVFAKRNTYCYTFVAVPDG